MTKAESTALQQKPPPALAVVDWLLTGASEHQVREALEQNYPDADANKIMASVKTHLAAAGNPDANAVKGWAIMAYRSLYQKMLATGDYDGCRKVIKEITLLAV
jgi:hypothetical protein